MDVPEFENDVKQLPVEQKEPETLEVPEVRQSSVAAGKKGFSAELKSEKPQKKKMKKSTKIILIVGICILTLLLAAMITVFALFKHLTGKMSRSLDTTPLPPEQVSSLLAEKDTIPSGYTGPVLDADDPVMPEDEAERIQTGKNIVNILLVGQDRRVGQYRQRSDAMILCTIDKDAKTLTMTSFMRDLWVRIPGYFDERLNVPYALEGFHLLNKTLEYQFGVHADHIIEVDFSGFEAVVNRLGGVTINLTGAEAGYMNKNHGWSLSSGVQKLNGEEALAYSRIRGIDSDFNRTNRQRTVLNAVIESMRGMSLTEMYSFAEEVLPLVTTDMQDSDIAAYIFQYAGVLGDLKVVSQRIPMDGTYHSVFIDGKSVLLMYPEDLQKNRDFLKKTLGG